MISRCYETCELTSLVKFTAAINSNDTTLCIVIFQILDLELNPEIVVRKANNSQQISLQINKLTFILLRFDDLC
jgi:hypothetical protein